MPRHKRRTGANLHFLTLPDRTKLTYQQIMLAHSKADLHEESLGYWRQLVCLDGVGQVAIDPPTFTSALKSAIACNQWDEVETIADMLKVGGWVGRAQASSIPVKTSLSPRVMR